MIQHGQLYLRDMVPPRSTYYAQGRFGRLFPTLPAFRPDTLEVRDALLKLGEPGGVMDAQDPPGPQPNPANPDNQRIPAGFTFLGQFIDHDVTFDPTSSLERQVDPESIANFRTPAMELDSVYASGRAATPYLYDANTNRTKFLVETVPNSDAPNQADDDLPRNSQETAIIGDPRNDENLIVGQLHLALLKFHNAVVDHLEAQPTPPADVFAEAQRLVRWHYQWIVMHEFLPKTVGDDLCMAILDGDGGKTQDNSFGHQRGRKYYNWRNAPYIPVEFSVAAYRFGHSQVRPGYSINANLAAPIFRSGDGSGGPGDLRGGKRGPNRVVDWSNFFDFGGDTFQKSRAINTKLSSPLFSLPFFGPNLPTNPSSLAQRNLLRHLTFSVPSGQDVARAMKVDPLSEQDLSGATFLERSTPLWFYILREAEMTANGEHLGPVGGRIVAEVLIGLLEGDRLSYLRTDPNWTPTLGGTQGEFRMVDLLNVAGVA
jgi:hypothetical protein